MVRLKGAEVVGKDSWGKHKIIPVVNEGMHTSCPAVYVAVIIHVNGHRKRLQHMLQYIVHALPHPNDVQVHTIVVPGGIRKNHKTVQILGVAMPTCCSAANA